MKNVAKLIAQKLSPRQSAVKATDAAKQIKSLQPEQLKHVGGGATTDSPVKSW